MPPLGTRRSLRVESERKQQIEKKRKRKSAEKAIARVSKRQRTTPPTGSAEIPCPLCGKRCTTATQGRHLESCLRKAREQSAKRVARDLKASSAEDEAADERMRVTRELLEQLDAAGEESGSSSSDEEDNPPASQSSQASEGGGAGDGQSDLVSRIFTTTGGARARGSVTHGRLEATLLDALGDGRSSRHLSAKMGGDVRLAAALLADLVAAGHEVPQRWFLVAADCILDVRTDQRAAYALSGTLTAAARAGEGRAALAVTQPMWQRFVHGVLADSILVGNHETDPSWVRLDDGDAVQAGTSHMHWRRLLRWLERVALVAGVFAAALLADPERARALVGDPVMAEVLDSTLSGYQHIYGGEDAAKAAAAAAAAVARAAKSPSGRCRMADAVPPSVRAAVIGSLAELRAAVKPREVVEVSD